jgi:hypothetical protein
MVLLAEPRDTEEASETSQNHMENTKKRKNGMKRKKRRIT